MHESVIMASGIRKEDTVSRKNDILNIAGYWYWQRAAKLSDLFLLPRKPFMVEVLWARHEKIARVPCRLVFLSCNNQLPVFLLNLVQPVSSSILIAFHRVKKSLLIIGIVNRIKPSEQLLPFSESELSHTFSANCTINYVCFAYFRGNISGMDKSSLT